MEKRTRPVPGTQTPIRRGRPAAATPAKRGPAPSPAPRLRRGSDQLLCNFGLFLFRVFAITAVLFHASLAVPAPKTSLRPRHAFTLVEILVVIGVIAILLVAVIPAVNSISKSSGRKASAGALLGAIEQARSQAIKDGQPTYLVFPTFASGTQATLDRYNYESYAIFEDDAANPNTPKQITPWKTLPSGISLRANSGSGQEVTNLPDLASVVTKIPPFTIDTTVTPLFYCIKFNTDGGMDNPATNFTLAVFEGYVNGGSEVPTANPIVIETITIAHLTGRAVHDT
jgi:prepilin-type N-terminal cleavage/methylation domain-containing protein